MHNFLFFYQLHTYFCKTIKNKLATFLYIDTSGEKATVAISHDHHVLAMEENTTANTHAAFVQPAIDRILQSTNILIQSLDAVVVTMGPGSYTGLRVGLASAKGIAYAIDKPLIGISTLTMLAKHAISNKEIIHQNTATQIFSMIDARRMEVFGAFYKSDLTPLQPEQAIVLDELLMRQLLGKGPVVCIGSGAAKTRELITAPNLYCFDDQYNMADFTHLALEKWAKKDFEDIAYSRPSYLKDFYQAPAKGAK
jgi:tRNA threonylcarbamoyladenosine biosynthesis protein TsaB